MRVKHPQDRLSGSMSAEEFEARVARIHWPLSALQAQRARSVLVDGVTVTDLAEQEGVSRGCIYKPIRALRHIPINTPDREG